MKRHHLWDIVMADRDSLVLSGVSMQIGGVRECWWTWCRGEEEVNESKLTVCTYELYCKSEKLNWPYTQYTQVQWYSSPPAYMQSLLLSIALLYISQQYRKHFYSDILSFRECRISLPRGVLLSPEMSASFISSVAAAMNCPFAWVRGYVRVMSRFHCLY